MLENHRCRCVICSVERQLASDLTASPTVDRFRTLAADHPALSDFESPSAVIAFLHSRPHDAVRSKQSNEIIKALLASKKESCNGQAFFQDLLVLTFVPTLHKTYREISFRFTGLHREDVGQQVLTSFLELASSPALQRRNGYLSAALARGLRKSVFRWAFKESRNLPKAEFTDGCPSNDEAIADVDIETPFVLRNFLARCLETGVLTHSEYDLLVKFNLEGLQAKELANGNSGLTPTAVHRRLQRIMTRLRDTATAPSLISEKQIS